MAACIEDLEKNGHLVRFSEEVDGDLEMAAIHLKMYEINGPAILFENIKDCDYKAVSNLFGTIDRSRFLFRDTIEHVKTMVSLKANPDKALKKPFKYVSTALAAYKALPKKVGRKQLKKFRKGKISDLPQIKCWPMDGGPFVTLPVVYSEDIDQPGVMKSNLGMYRIQLGGNDYQQNEEVGLHYQLHRGIGVHQTKANRQGKPLKVSVFVGGPPSLSFAAVMPLPEDLSEANFAGALGGRRFRYCYDEEGFCVATDADFVITGEVYPDDNKPEGPFGDHLGYYSLTHDFPVMKVRNVYIKEKAVWPFTVVGRPPQEDTSFGDLIHEITASILPKEIPGLKEVHAVDAAGVHPLLLAIGSERYTPYLDQQRPQEVLTIANHILGKGQMSLAKYLFITSRQDNEELSTHDYDQYFEHILTRADWSRDVHFYTNTSIDTLDYSGEGLNVGSKVVIAAVGDTKRTLATEIHEELTFEKTVLLRPGILCVELTEGQEIQSYIERLEALTFDSSGYPLIVVVDDANFVAKDWKNFLWVTFTRSNPAQDIYGTYSTMENKHWSCGDNLIIDARIKQHHAPPLIPSKEISERVEKYFQEGGPLYKFIKN